MKKLNISVMAFLLLISVKSFGAASTPHGVVKVLHYYETHAGFLIRHEHMSDPHSCGRSDWFNLSVDHPHYHTFFSLLMYAHRHRLPTVISTDGCYEGMNKIVHIVVEEQPTP